MKQKAIRFLLLALTALLLLAIPLSALAYDDGTLCNAMQSGKHDWRSSEYKEPTCTADGYRTYKCRNCGATGKTPEVLPALGHEYGNWTVTTQPTCSKDGVETGTCWRCGATTTRPVPCLGHAWVSEQKEPTCTEDGYYREVCSRCGDSATKVLPALGHSVETLPGRPATCTASGLTEGSKCSRCGAVLTAQQTIAALGHQWSDWTQTTAPTCTAAGTETRTCTRRDVTGAPCGATETRSVAALGHQ